MSHAVPGALFNSPVHHGDPLCANLKGEHSERSVSAAWRRRGSSQHSSQHQHRSSQQGPAAICSLAFPRTSRHGRPRDAGCQQRDVTNLLTCCPPARKDNNQSGSKPGLCSACLCLQVYQTPKPHRAGGHQYRPAPKSWHNQEGPGTGNTTPSGTAAGLGPLKTPAGDPVPSRWWPPW